MAGGRQLYAAALFALRLPPGSLIRERPGGTTFSLPTTWAQQARRDVEVILFAGYSFVASAQEAEASWLEFLREHYPPGDGWTCHSAKVEALPDIEEMIDRLDRGEPLVPEAPIDGTEPPDDSPVM